MSTDTIFYIIGSVVAVLAVVLSFAGIKAKNFPSKGALGGILALFAVLVIATSGLAVAVARHEQDVRRAEQAEAQHQTEESVEPTPSDSADGSSGGSVGSEDEGQGSEQPAGGDEADGAGETLELAADETALAYDKTELEASAGSVTIEFDNPAAIPHDVVVRDESGADVARTDVITESSDSLTADLEPGEYQFYCSVPGHEQAGMVGTLTVE